MIRYLKELENKGNFYLPLINQDDRGKKELDDYQLPMSFIEKYQTNYELYGIEGYFDASWFEEVRNKTFMAVAHNKPVIEKEYKCTIIEIVNGKLHLLNWNLYEIENVCQIEENLFKVKAVCNSFIVQIG